MASKMTSFPRISRPLGALALVAVVVALVAIVGFGSGVDLGGVGFREKPNRWDEVCTHEKAYLSALEAGESEKVAEAQQLLESDMALFRGDETWERTFQRIAASAGRGDPQPARHNVKANC